MVHCFPSKAKIQLHSNTLTATTTQEKSQTKTVWNLTRFPVLFLGRDPDGFSAFPPERLRGPLPECSVSDGVVHGVSDNAMALRVQTCTNARTNPVKPGQGHTWSSLVSTQWD